MVETKTLANNGIKLTPKQAELYSGFCKMNVMELHSLAKSVLEIRSTVEALLYHADQLFEESGIALEALNKQLAEEGSIEQGNIEEGAVHVIPSLSSLSSLSQSSNDSERYRYPAPEESQDADPYEGVYWVVEALEYTAQSAILLRENVSGKKVEGRLRDIVAVDAHKLLDGKIESKGDQRSVGALANGLFKALHKRSTDLHEKVNELNKVATSSEQSIAA